MPGYLTENLVLISSSTRYNNVTRNYLRFLLSYFCVYMRNLVVW